ncbi:MAG: DedA family protein [Pseudarcicella sp.]|nr:DedA family protein [Pseudarcicella sp.]
MAFNEVLKYLSDSKEIINAGLWAITFVVYAENGIFFAFFLPGDYLLFLTGVFVGTGILKATIATVMLYLFLAAVIGSLQGYLVGRFFGKTFENKPDTWYFKQKHLKGTQDFMEKYGNQALIITRFLPYIRTFAPILAGISKMSYPKYIFLNVLGAVLWIGILVGGGNWIGVKYPQIIDYVHYVILFFLAVTTFTLIKSYLKIKNNA